MSNKVKTCWVITDGKAGMISQALGLAEAIGINTIVKNCSYNLPWSLFPPYTFFNSPRFLNKNSDQITEPWPDLLISCGRQGLGVSLYVRKQSKGECFTICVQDPRINCDYFDLVIPLAHDNVVAKNAIISNMSLHRITKSKLEEGKKLHEKLFTNHKAPFLIVLIGGSTHRYNMNLDACKDLANKFDQILANSDGTLYITPSRRTPQSLIKLLEEKYANNNRVILVDPNVNNPYFGMLANADCIFVTDDSVNMISEACATGKRTYILPLKGHEQGKSKIFTANLLKQEIVELYINKVEPGDSNSSNETLVIAEKIRNMLIKERNFKQKDFKI